ncbi:MAG: hypothetical protein KFF73_15970 [Cyclobacteriaceae bacterium]|nr:hypothetical protein [Cyclobacteriaceae bacterium]
MQKLILLMLMLPVAMPTASGQYYEGPYDPVKIHYKTPGFISINEIGYGSGLGESDTISLKYSEYFVSVTSILGYYVSQNFIFGAGTGAYFYNGGTLIPIFGDMRFTYNFKRINPYASGSGGFLFYLSDPGSNIKLFISPMVGVRMVVTYSVAATASVGAHIQEGGAMEDRDTFINFKLGVHIKPRRK